MVQGRIAVVTSLASNICDMFLYLPEYLVNVQGKSCDIFAKIMIVKGHPKLQ